MSTFYTIPTSPPISCTVLKDEWIAAGKPNFVRDEWLEVLGVTDIEPWPAGTEYKYTFSNGSYIIIQKLTAEFTSPARFYFNGYTKRGIAAFTGGVTSTTYDIETDGLTFTFYADPETGLPWFGLTRRLPNDDLYCIPIVHSFSEEYMPEFMAGLDFTDPNSQGGNSGEGGGGGTFDGSSDVIGVPSLPTISAVDTGFVTLYNPNLGSLKNLADFMWSDNFFDNIVKLFADPMEAILSLAIVPVAVPDGGQRYVKIGNVTTTIPMNRAAAQYIELNCGTLNMKEYWGSALDYAPHTKVQLYLPYIGYKMVDADEIIGKTLGIIYHVDILTGACVAYVHTNGSVVYQWEGNCACFLPISGTNWSNIINSGLRVMGTAAAMASGTGAITAGTLATGLINTAGNVMGAKAVIEHGGTSSGSGGQMAVRYPYLIVERPRQSLAAQYNRFEGYPSNITSKLGDLSGYTSVESVHLEGINATDAELAEIESLLKGGVIL